MEPVRDSQATLVDLLDRILDKGLILNTDLIIHVAGIPLLGVNLKACLAGMETMLRYGIWQDWDEAQRAVAKEESRLQKQVPLTAQEHVLLKIFASLWYSKGIYHNWRPGHLYITDQRVFLYRKEPAEVLFQCTYEQITRLVLERKSNIAGTETEYLYLLLGSEELVQLHPSDAHLVLQTIQDRMEELGLKTDESAALPLLDETARKFLLAEEHVLNTGKMSHLVAEKRPGNTVFDVWKPGHLYLTTKRLVWWYDFDGAIGFEAPLDTVVHCETKRKNLGGMLKNKLVFDIVCQPEQNKQVVHSFSDDENQLAEWEKVLGMYVNEKYSEEEEKCPRCGTKNPVAILLASGCPKCGWVSARMRREEREHAYRCV